MQAQVAWRLLKHFLLGHVSSESHAVLYKVNVCMDDQENMHFYRFLPGYRYNVPQAVVFKPN